MTEQRKRLVMAGVEQALDTVLYGKVIIELRGPSAPIDIVTEERTRYPEEKVVKSTLKTGETRTD